MHYRAQHLAPQPQRCIHPALQSPQAPRKHMRSACCLHCSSTRKGARSCCSGAGEQPHMASECHRLSKALALFHRFRASARCNRVQALQPAPRACCTSDSDSPPGKSLASAPLSNVTSSSAAAVDLKTQLHTKRWLPSIASVRLHVAIVLKHRRCTPQAMRTRARDQCARQKLHSRRPSNRSIAGHVMMNNAAAHKALAPFNRFRAPARCNHVQAPQPNCMHAAQALATLARPKKASLALI